MKKYLIYITALLLILSCSTSHKSLNSSPASSYKKEANAIHPQFVIFNASDTSSELHFKIASKEILYTRPDGINFTSNILISYRLVSSYDSKDIIDSGSVRLLDVNNDNADKFLIGKLNFRAQAPNSYFLRVKVADLNRNTEISSTLEVTKDNDLNRQNFIIRSATNDAPIFRNYVRTNEAVTINYKSKIGVSIFVRYYNREFPLAAPPFSMTEPKPFQYRPDSTYTLLLSPNGSVKFIAPKKGFYHIQLDTTKRDGITIFNYPDAFPDIRKADDMIFPLRYITSQQEYTDLVTSSNKKAAVDKFWMDCTGSQERAKEIIRKYYNRVQDANTYFTSYLEGWKTDRGMIYLIYGAPNVIYKTENAETWTYGEENNLNSLSYSFSKINNPFTDNDYALERSAVYKQSWYMAVDIWRQGRAYLQD